MSCVSGQRSGWVGHSVRSKEGIFCGVRENAKSNELQWIWPRAVDRVQATIIDVAMFLLVRWLLTVREHFNNVL